MHKLPRWGAPGCTSLFIGIFLFLLGSLILVGSVASMAGEKQFDLLRGLLFFLVAIVLLFFAWGLLKDSFAAGNFEGILPSNPEKAARPTLRELNALAKVKEDVGKAPSPDEVIKLLARTGEGKVKTANPQLQLVAFALRPTSPLDYLTGVILETFTWVALLTLFPFILLWTAIEKITPWDSEKFGLQRAIKFIRLARRLRIRPHKIFKRDARPPILYLRSFWEDSEGKDDSYFPATSEERLTSFYKQYGPVIAVGQPGEKLPLLGASRIYFDDSVWQAGVLYLMSISQIVVIHADIANGLLWELGVARQKLEPQRLVISFAAWKDLDEQQRRFRYLQFKEYAERILPCEFPPEMLASSLLFGPDWVPYFECAADN